MFMASLIEEDAQINKNSQNAFVEKLKGLVHDQLKKRAIIFTVTNQNSKFHYYTTLDSQKNQFIELYWVVQFLVNNISISVSYSTYRSMGVPIMFNDLRMKIQTSCILRVLNKGLPYFLTFLLNQKYQVIMHFQRSFFHQSDRLVLLKSIKSIVSQIYQQCIQSLSCLQPYFSISIQSTVKAMKGQEQSLQTQQFNLIKLKNTFDRFRKNRQKTADLIYQQKDVQKMRKKIQSSITLLGIQLRSLANSKFTTKQIRRDKLLQIIQTHETGFVPAKVDRIAYQFQILKVQQDQTKFQVNANSQIYMGKYNFRIFKTLMQELKIAKSLSIKINHMPAFQEKDIIEERESRLVKKKSNGKLSEKALKNQISFLKFMRNQICIYIANYYLPWQNVSRQVYIQYYQQSLLKIVYVKSLKSFPHRLQIMIKLLKGIKFLSDSNICHRDIKPSNVMVDKLNDPKIIDFGSSIFVENHKLFAISNQKLCATEGYHYPYEKCNEKIKFFFTKKQYQSHPLFDAYSYAVIMEKMFSWQLQQNFNNDMIKDTLTFIIERCKQHNPDNRLSYEQILCLLLVLKKTTFNAQKKQQIL